MLLSHFRTNRQHIKDMLLLFYRPESFSQNPIPLDDKHLLINELPASPFQQVPHSYESILAENLLPLPVVQQSFQNLLYVVG
jgi:hypothetical protein